MINVTGCQNVCRWVMGDNQRIQVHFGGAGPISLTVYEIILKYWSNHFCSYHKLIRLQFCTSHDSSAVMTCAKLWPDCIIIFQLRAIWIFAKFGLWAHKPFVKWVPGPFWGTCVTRENQFLIRFPQSFFAIKKSSWKCACISMARSHSGITTSKVCQP